jgi:hypothetical protein
MLTHVVTALTVEKQAMQKRLKLVNEAICSLHRLNGHPKGSVSHSQSGANGRLRLACRMAEGPSVNDSLNNEIAAFTTSGNV